MHSYNGPNYVCSGAGKKEQQDYMKAVDMNKDGYIDMDEFADSCTNGVKQCEFIKKINADTFKEEGCLENGPVNQGQFKKCIEKIGGGFF